MNTLSLKIASMIKQANPEETGSIEVMQYALNIILNSLLIIALSLLIGWTTGHFADTALALLSFALLRVLSGGRHLPNAFSCNLFSITLCSLIPQIAFLFRDHAGIINLISLLLMLLFAPAPDVNARIPLRWYPRMKLLAVLTVGLNFFLLSPVIGLTFLAQSLTVISWRRRKQT